ncbi:MAG: hypothetical protein ABI240_13380 [Sphingomonas sp.]
MRVIVTGAGGYVGRALIAAGHDVAGIGTVPTNAPRAIVGDISDPAILTLAFAGGCDAAPHRLSLRCQRAL